VRQKLKTFTDHQLPADDPDYINLRARQFLLDAQNAIAPELLALKIRTKYHRLAEFTGLHIFVVTLRCEHSCPYCQVSRQSDDKIAFDMTPEIAEKTLDLVFRSLSRAIKIDRHSALFR
jgi:sulfatase maturation enzyme AslB (radical SAM superfamily)